MKTNLRIIGDVHEYYGRYHQLIRKSESSIQVGDFGFKYTTLSGVDARQHRILGGNHDNYDKMGNWPHFLGDYGVHTVLGFGDIFFVRGGFSIDRSIRIEGVSWWNAEELSMAKCYEALAEYTKVRPNFVVSHECPLSIVPHFLTRSMRVITSRTSQLLERMFSVHRPRRWVFGHHHQSLNKIVNNTHFTCLNSLECLDF